MGISKSGVEWYLRQDDFLHGTDYYRLEGRTLAQFKAENPKYHRNVPCVNVITKSGFDKLVKIFGTKVDTPELFIEEKQPSAPDEPMYTATESMISLLGYIDRQMILIAEYRRRLLSPCTVKEAEVYRRELAKAMRELKWYHIDTETIRIG